MSEEARKAVEAMQEAVDEMLEHDAKLGLKVVIGDKHGNPKLVSARYLVRKRKAALASVRNKPSKKRSKQSGGDLT